MPASSRWWLAALLAVITRSAGALQDAPPMATDRPDQTESAVLVPPGLVQLEVGGTHVFDRAGGGPAWRASNVGGALLRVGLADPVEARFGFAGWQRERVDGATATSGFGDLALGTKIRIRDGLGLSPAVAVIGNVMIPVGDPDFRADGVDPSIRVAVAHDLGGGFSVGYNLGALWTTVPGDAGDESLETSLLYTATIGRQLLPALGAFVEAYGVHGLANGAGSWLAVDAGVTIPVRVNLQFDLSAGAGVSEAASDWFLSAGLSVRAPR